MRLLREPLISEGETTHGRRPVRCPVRTADTEVPWLVQPGRVVVRVCPGNAVVRQEEVAPTMRSAGHRVGDWNGGKAYGGFLRERVIRHPQRGRQGEDNAPYRVATRVRSHERPNFVISSPRSECADGLIRIQADPARSALHGNPSRLIVAILSRNVMQTAARFFGPFHRAAETNLCKSWFSYSNNMDRNRKTEPDADMFRRSEDNPTSSKALDIAF
jgi:hypothetical protein